MDEALIGLWNDTVREQDEVWFLGDFALRTGAERTAEIFGRLNGTKHLVKGNHDFDQRTLRLAWASIHDRAVIMLEGTSLVLDHYSMRSWPKAHYGAIHLFGHSHGALPPLGNSLDVGVDCWDYRPTTLSQIRERLGIIVPT